MPEPAQERAPREATYFSALDGLRALAVLAVVWHHTRPSGATAPIATRGYLGVDVFFVISGFLITTLLLREERERGRIALGRFWMRRVLRLFPLWYALLAALALAFAFVVPSSPMGEAFFDELPWHATYTSNFIVGASILSISWSLAMEEQFYLLWPPILARAKALIAPLALVAVGVSVGVHVGAFDHLFERWIGPRWKEFSLITATLLPLVLGCALAAPRLPRAVERCTAPRTVWVWTAALVGIALAPIAENHMRFGAQIAACGIVAAAARGEHRLLEFAPLRWLGVRAYGVYLLHMPIRELLYTLGLAEGGERGIEVFLATSLAAALAAGISYRWLERPFLRLKSRFR